MSVDLTGAADLLSAGFGGAILVNSDSPTLPKAVLRQAVEALLPVGPQDIGPTYQIAMGDELDVKFLYQPEQSVHVPVRPDGRISLPVSGELDVVDPTAGVALE